MDVLWIQPGGWLASSHSRNTGITSGMHKTGQRKVNRERERTFRWRKEGNAGYGGKEIPFEVERKCRLRKM